MRWKPDRGCKRPRSGSRTGGNNPRSRTGGNGVGGSRTGSNEERSSMGVFRAVGNYMAGMLIAIVTIPVTNMLGGTQEA